LSVGFEIEMSKIEQINLSEKISKTFM